MLFVSIRLASLRSHVCSCKPSTVRSNLGTKVGWERDLNTQQPGHGNVAEEFYVRMHLSTCICVCSCACVLLGVCVCAQKVEHLGTLDTICLAFVCIRLCTSVFVCVRLRTSVCVCEPSTVKSNFRQYSS